MTHVTSMLETYPKDLGHIDKQKLADCIAACFECAQTCTACGDACLSEDMVAQLSKGIRTNLDCADICATTGKVLSGTPATTPTSPGRFFRPVKWRTRPVGTSARATRRCTSTAGSARRCAGAASKRVRS